jgi:serine phosphatase RsbU (regulator of sigma subunit)
VQKGLRAIYFVAIGLSIIINFVDIFELKPLIAGKLYIDSFTILILFVSLLFFFLKKFSLQKSYEILVYTIILSTILSFYLYRNISGLLPVLLRDSLFLLCVITISVFVLNKRHALIISILFLANIVILAIISDEPILRQNVPVIIVVFSFYAVVLYYIVNMRERYLEANQQSNLMNKAQNDKINSQNTELKQQSEEIRWLREWMDSQTIMIEKKSRDILDNLMFARSIQKSILPKEIEYQNHLPDSFILHMSKDEISGDFYWIREKAGKLYVAAVDCTGHGVSGALVSMIGFLSLNRALAELSEPNPAEILNKLDSIFQTEFNHSYEDFNSKIGMDIALISIMPEKRKLEFSGAFNPLYIVRQGELIQTKANHYMLGIEVDEFFHHFENHVFEILPGDSIYIFSDGFPDQFGGPLGKKFSYERLRKVLIEISGNPMEVQKAELKKVWENWKGEQEQTDDILVMGFRL